MRHLLWTYVALSTLLACEGEPEQQLHIDLVTDLVPVIEFDVITLEIGEGEFAERDDFRAEERDYVHGVRLRSAEVPAGALLVTGTLYDDNVVVAQRRVLVEVREGTSQSVTLVISRDCRGVMCPASGNPTFDTCLGGRCVDPRCTPETPEYCTPECISDDECQEEFASCAAPSCQVGVCLGEASDATCDDAEYCDGTLGCRPRPPRLDSDAGVDSGVMDAGSDAMVRCATEEYVSGHLCVSCPTGATRPSGDDPAGEDTICDDVCSRTFGVTCDVFDEGYFKASNTDAGDRFGDALALDGDTLAVGAIGEASAASGVGGDQADNSSANSGAVYIFRRTAGAWAQEAYLKASNAEAGDRFGVSLALYGDTLVVGAVREASAATGVGGDQADNSAARSGAAYVFRRTGGTWVQEAYLKASNADAGDSFGSSIALDGDSLAVAAESEDSGATGVDGDQTDDLVTLSGAVYVFRRTGGTWAQEGYVKASNPGGFDQFGQSLSIDGDALAVGAYDRSAATGVGGDEADNSAVQSGAVYIFRRTGRAWAQEAYVKASNTDASDGFGVTGLSLDGDTLAVGAHAEASGATGIGGDQSDNSVAFSGAVYVFRRVAGTWAQEAYLKASTTDQRDRFGIAVALDGDSLAVGVFGEGSAATSVDGDQSNNSAPGAGAVYIFRRTGTWAQVAYVKASNTGVGDSFGISLVLDGDTFAVTAIGEDSATTGVDGDETDNSAEESGAVYLRRIAP